MSYGNEVVLWSSPNGIIIPAETMLQPKSLVNYAVSLRPTERQKIISAIDANLFDMATEYVWKRTMNRLKSSVLDLGLDFVMEMVGRPIKGVSTHQNPDELLTEVEIINLATDLGIIDRTAQLLFLQQVELINHFAQQDVEVDMPPLSAISCISYCIQYVLGYNDEHRIQFNGFRERLYSELIDDKDGLLDLLETAAYFYKRTAVRSLLNLIKTKEGGELDNALHNYEKLIPKLWSGLSGEDKWSIGHAYADMVSVGHRKQVSYMKSALTKVKGFDFVPETLRSRTFIEAAYELQKVHYEYNNFYNEPTAAKKLEDLGTIPSPAVGACMTAILVCKLGNQYGIARDAQVYLDRMLQKTPEQRWTYYLEDVLPTDTKVLAKLITSAMFTRWTNLVESYELYRMDIKNSKVKRLLDLTHRGNKQSCISIVNDFLAGNIN